MELTLTQPTPIKMKRSSYFILLLIVAGIILAPWVYAKATQASQDINGHQVFVWLAELALMTLFFLKISYHVTGSVKGFLVDERNLMSLSRFQVCVWTLLILSAYLTATLLRIHLMPDLSNAASIEIDWRLWSLMGISSASLVGSPLINLSKQTKTVHPSVTDTVDLTNAPAQGTLFYNTNFKDAQFTDMFEGDEITNAYYIDLSKVQMFFFTLIAAVTYFALIWQMFNSMAITSVNQLPSLSQGFIALLGISHLAYLTSKGIGNTATLHQ
jgi:hypothetical protein